MQKQASKDNHSSLLGLPPKLPPKPMATSFKSRSNGLANKQPGLLGEYPATAAAVNALRGLLPLPLPKATPTSLSSSHKSTRSVSSLPNSKSKIRKQPRKQKERRDSTTESDEAAGMQ